MRPDPSAIQSRTDLASFVRELQRSLTEDPQTWENCDLPSYLEALAAWIADMDGYFENRGEAVPSRPDWRLVGEMLLAATLYE